MAGRRPALLLVVVMTHGGAPALARGPTLALGIHAPPKEIECTHDLHCPPDYYCQHRLARMGVCRHRVPPPAPGEPAQDVDWHRGRCCPARRRARVLRVAGGPNLYGKEGLPKPAPPVVRFWPSFAPTAFSSGDLSPATRDTTLSDEGPSVQPSPVWWQRPNMPRTSAAAVFAHESSLITLPPRRPALRARNLGLASTGSEEHPGVWREDRPLPLRRPHSRQPVLRGPHPPPPPLHAPEALRRPRSCPARGVDGLAGPHSEPRPPGSAARSYRLPSGGGGSDAQSSAELLSLQSGSGDSGTFI